MATTKSLNSSTNDRYRPFYVDLKSAHDIPKACTQLARILAEQPLFDGRGSPVKNCKVIALSCWLDATICSIFNANSINTHENMNSRNIRRFGCAKHQFYDSQRNLIECGIYLPICNEIKMCTYEALGESYDKVFSAMVNGWERVDVKDHPDIMYRENPEEFDLFIKDTSLKEEDTLIRSIVGKLSLAENVKCYSQWLTHPGYRSTNKMYLWVRKTELNSTMEKTGLNLGQ